MATYKENLKRIYSQIPLRSLGRGRRSRFRGDGIPTGSKRIPRPKKARTIKDVVVSVTDLLNQSNVKYMVTGGVVVPFYGRVRTTTDIDLIVEYDEPKLKSLVKALNRHGFKVPWEWVEESLRNKTHFTVLDKYSPYRLDVKVLELGEKLEKAVKVKLFGKPTYITTPEALIIYKLRYGGEIDAEDVRSIILRQKGKLDRQYLFRKAEEQGVQKERLRKLLEEEDLS